MNRLNFISSGGEMGRLIREKNWEETSLGNPTYWPQSLKTTLSIILNSKFPNFLFWGEELLCFYNDAFRPSLGNDGKHPAILGKRGEDAWAEVWPTINLAIKQVLLTGEATWSENQLLPFYRNGKLEDVYWTFSYSPLVDEDGKIAGVFSTCVETTKEVNARLDLQKINRRYQDHIMQAPVAMSILTGSDFIVEIVNDLMLQIWGKKLEDVLHKPIFEGLPEAKGQGLELIMEEVFRTGLKFEAKERLLSLPRNNGLEDFYLNFVYEPIKDINGNVVSIMAIANDITYSVKARHKILESEEKLNIIIESSGLAVWEYDLKKQFGVISKRYAQIFGYNDVGELDRETILKHLHPDDAEIRDEAELAMEQSGQLVYESRIIWLDGSIHWIEVNGKLFYDEESKPSKMIGTIKDITQDKRNEQELKDREEKFRLLANEMPQFVWTADANGNVNYFNQSLYNYTGLTEDKVTNDKWIEFTHPEERAENLKVWMNAVKAGKDYLFENRFRRQDGVYRWQLSRAKPHKDVNGNIQMWVGTSTDINEIKELDEQKDYFISMASHELKTPITSIKGYVQILEMKYRNTEDQFLKNALKVVHKQIETLSTLVADLLDISKIKTGSLQLRKVSFSINNLIAEIVAEFQQINPQNKITFITSDSIEVCADEDNIRQVIINFLTNALKYSPNTKNVEVSLKLNATDVLIAVKDFGIGISLENQKKIFDRFFRVEGKNEKTFPGFGIGLYIAAEIIRKHNGNIGVNSEIGKGSTFYFTLPV